MTRFVCLGVDDLEKILWLKTFAKTTIVEHTNYADENGDIYHCRVTLWPLGDGKGYAEVVHYTGAPFVWTYTWAQLYVALNAPLPERPDWIEVCRPHLKGYGR